MLEGHRETNFCTCSSCGEMSTQGCVHPNKCVGVARELLNVIVPRWRPTGQEKEGEGAPTIEGAATRDQHGGVVVNTTRETTDLRSSIRIFMRGEGLVEATALQTAEGKPQARKELVVYTDGSCVSNGMAEARAGSGVWYRTDDPRNVAIRVPGTRQSNQIGELLAVLHTIKSTPRNQPLRICSDSRFTIDGLTKHAPGWEAKDWM